MLLTMTLLALPPLVMLILTQLMPFVIPVIASFLFKLINKGTTLVSGWSTIAKQVFFAVFNTLLVLLMTAIGVTDASGDIAQWTVATVEGVLGAIAAMFLYDNGKAAARQPDPVA